jgi:hypothetical protein
MLTRGARLILFLTLVFQVYGFGTDSHSGAAAAGGVTLYGDTLSAGWEDWSWGSQTHSFTNTTPLHSGSASIRVTFTGGWSGVQIGTNATPPSTAAVNTLEFWINGGSSGGQSVHVSAGNDCASVSLDVTPSANQWTKFSLSLVGLGTPASIKSVSWSNPTANTQAAFYVDDVALANAVLPPPAVTSGPALTVNAAAGRHPISPYIYGLNFPDESLAADLNLPVQRWGGNSTTRYNYLNDTANTASDWYFENIANKTPNPALLPDGSASDLFIEQAKRTGTQVLLTVPLIGWTPKSRTLTCGFSVAKYGAQTDTDYWAPDCGKGILSSNGKQITGNDPTDTSQAISPAFDQGWITYLKAKYGSSNNGGVRFYDLDNEPMLWNSTHIDVHPNPTSYDELRDRTFAYAPAIKASDPNALTLGPVLWGWTAYFYSALDEASGGAWWNNPLDRLAHNNTPFVEWYLQQMKTYEQQHGLRILDYLDLHYYPQSFNSVSNNAGDVATQQMRLRSTRSLWDPNYTDESWIADQVNLIPRMHGWVNTNYPGTKLAISEYSWGAMCHINGALAQADVLGIFGREGLDLATLWGPPGPNEPGAYAFRMYRNFDGSGGSFGETGVQAASADRDKLAVYAAQRSLDDSLTVLVINKTAGPLSADLGLSGFQPGVTAKVYRYSIDQLNAIATLPQQAVGLSGFSAAYPGNSITLYVIPYAGERHNIYVPKVFSH